jgi:hypothetical protein
MNHDLQEAVENSKNDYSSNLSKPKSSNNWKSEIVSFAIMKYQVVATRTHPVFL